MTGAEPILAAAPRRGRPGWSKRTVPQSFNLDPERARIVDELMEANGLKRGEVYEAAVDCLRAYLRLTAAGGRLGALAEAMRELLAELAAT